MQRLIACGVQDEPPFESAVAKLQGNDFNLTPGEKKKASHFLVCDSEAGSDEDEDHANMSYTKSP